MQQVLLISDEVIQDHPAYSIHKPVPTRHFDLDREVVKIYADDIIGLPFDSTRHGTMYHWFRVGSVVSYALAYCEDPIATYARAKEKGHNLHWLNAMAVSITNQRRAKERRVGMSWGDEVAFEGRLFRIEKAPNQNARLVDITEE